MQKLLELRWPLASILVLILGIFWIWLSIVPPGTMTMGEITTPQEGFTAPDFELITLEGDSISLSELRGKAILVNFWATWCPPCRSEMPAMQQVFSDYDPDDFIILAINTTYQDHAGDVNAFVLEQGLTFPILLDDSGEISKRYQVNSMPTSYFIDPDGIINEVVFGGPMSEALLRTRVNRLLEEKN